MAEVDEKQDSILVSILRLVGSLEPALQTHSGLSMHLAVVLKLNVESLDWGAQREGLGAQ